MGIPSLTTPTNWKEDGIGRSGIYLKRGPKSQFSEEDFETAGRAALGIYGEGLPRPARALAYLGMSLKGKPKGSMKVQFLPWICFVFEGTPFFCGFSKGHQKDTHHFGGSNIKKDEPPMSWMETSIGVSRFRLEKPLQGALQNLQRALLRLKRTWRGMHGLLPPPPRTCGGPGHAFAAPGMEPLG